MTHTRFLTSILLAATLIPAARAEKVELRTPNNSLILDVEQGQEPQFLYFGAALKSQDIPNIAKPDDANWSRADLYPAYGATHTQSEICLAMRHADGNMSTHLIVDKYQMSNIRCCFAKS